MTLRTPISTLFPYTTLFRSPIKGVAPHKYGVLDAVFVAMIQHSSRAAQVDAVALLRSGAYVGDRRKMHQGDRKSTRLNSSHVRNLVCRLLLEKKNDISVGG